MSLGVERAGWIHKRLTVRFEAWLIVQGVFWSRSFGSRSYLNVMHVLVGLYIIEGEREEVNL